jgi:hypothetical protein
VRQILITEDDGMRVTMQVEGIPSLSDRCGLLRLALALVEREMESKIEETRIEETRKGTNDEQIGDGSVEGEGEGWPLELDR